MVIGKWFRYGCVMTVLAAVGYGGAYAFDTYHSSETRRSETVTVPREYQAYFDTGPNFGELVYFFEDLARKKDAAYAFDILIAATLPTSIDTHLLGHQVGYVLYAQRGLAGLADCTADLGFACAHSIVISELVQNGMGTFDIINEACSSAIGAGAYDMCFHGFGHGVLAFVDYELPKAIELCEQVGTEEHSYSEIDECIGGVIMEMRGGIHAPEVWEENGKKYLSESNPFAMCEAEFMPEASKDICYIYITPFIFDMVTSRDLPEWSDYRPALNMCERVSDSAHRRFCYGGFAKEFVNFVYGRDVRMIAHASDEELRRMHNACGEAESDFGRQACLEYTVYQLYRSGLYPYDLGLRFCTLAADDNKDACFSTLSQSVLAHADEALRRSFCSDLEAVHRACAVPAS